LEREANRSASPRGAFRQSELSGRASPSSAQQEARGDEVHAGMKEAYLAAALDMHDMMREPSLPGTEVLSHRYYTPRGIRTDMTPDPVTGRMVRKSTLRGREKVEDPETGEVVSRTALQKRRKVMDPQTGELVSKGLLYQRQQVVDPETGELVRRDALRGRQKVMDPDTGELVSRNALQKRQKVMDPETGETITKTALERRQFRRRARRTEASDS